MHGLYAITLYDNKSRMTTTIYYTGKDLMVCLFFLSANALCARHGGGAGKWRGFLFRDIRYSQNYCSQDLRMTYVVLYNSRDVPNLRVTLVPAHHHRRELNLCASSAGPARLLFARPHANLNFKSTLNIVFNIKESTRACIFRFNLSYGFRISSARSEHYNIVLITTLLAIIVADT